MKRKPFLLALTVLAVCALATACVSALAQDRQAAQSTKVIVEANGTVQVPGESIPLSSFLSPPAKAYVTQHLRQMQAAQTH